MTIRTYMPRKEKKKNVELRVVDPPPPPVSIRPWLLYFGGGYIFHIKQNSNHVTIVVKAIFEKKKL